MTLEQYLRRDLATGVVDHVIVSRLNDKGEVVFYIYPSGADGVVKGFIVESNLVSPVTEYLTPIKI